MTDLADLLRDALAALAGPAAGLLAAVLLGVADALHLATGGAR